MIGRPASSMVYFFTSAMRSAAGKAPIVFAASAVLWIGAMGFLYRQEVAPAKAAGHLSPPLVQISSGLLFREEWMGIFYRGKQTGYLQNSLHPRKEEGFYGPALESTLLLDLPLPGVKNRIRSRALCLFSAGGEVHRLDFSLASARPEFALQGRTEGGRLQVSVAFDGRKRDFDLPLPRQALPPFSLTPLFALRPIEEGERFSLPVLDIPRTLPSFKAEFSELRFTVDEKTPGGSKLSSSYAGIGLDLWLGPDGDLLRVSTPLGWELRKQSHDEVMRYLQGGV